MKYRLLLPLVVLLGMLTMTPAFAASKKKPTPAPVVLPMIASVTATSVTISEKNVSRTFTINQFTEINVNGRRGTVADLKPGMTASITIGTDSSKLARINATSK
jgi:hypothetical protein